MDFLNTNFQSIDDLRKTDTIVSSLNAEREALEQSIRARSTEDQGIDDVYEAIVAQSAEISQQLDLLIGDFLGGSKTLDDCKSELLVLADKYGQLQLFTEVFEKLGDVDDVRRDQQLVEQYKPLHDRIRALKSADSGNVIGALKEVGESLERFKNGTDATDLRSQILASVTQEISRLIVTDFRPLFDTPAEGEVPSTDQLKQLLALQAADPLYKDARPLWALEAMISQNFAIKFKFHFNSNVETNMLDKPEWAFNFVRDWLAARLDTLNTEYSQILQNTAYEDCSFKEEYVYTVVELLKNKMKKNIKLIRNVPDDKTSSSLLIHLIEEMLNNDDYYVKIFRTNINFVDELILSDEDIAASWLEFERNFNFDKYNKIIANEDAFEIDFESVDVWVTKPTNSSILIKNLLNNLNLKYKLIKNLRFKLQLLTKIQLRILERYYGRLDEALNAFNNLFKKFKLLSSKSEEEDLIVGLKGIDRLLRIYCSLKYTVDSMENWNEDLLFVQLSKLINEDTFFSTLIRSYEQAGERVVRTIDEFINKEINGCLKAYFRISNWSQLSGFNGEPTLELSAGINALLPILEYIFRTLSEIDLIPVLTKVEDRVVKFFNESILNLNTFTKDGVLQLRCDLHHAIDTLRLYKNLKSYVKYDQVFHFMAVVDADVIYEMGRSKYGRFYEICSTHGFDMLKSEPQLALSAARRRVFV